MILMDFMSGLLHSHKFQDISKLLRTEGYLTTVEGVLNRRNLARTGKFSSITGVRVKRMGSITSE